MTPNRGLPGPLPQGETQLWHGSPSWQGLALRAFRVRTVALYFAVMLAARAAGRLSAGAAPADVAVSSAWLALLPVAAVGLLCLLAWLTARTTVYTVTSRRVVMRVGIALQMTINVPFRIVGSAGLKLHGDGTGDVPLALTGDGRIGYLHLWPHARPWRLSRPEPMLRAVPDAARVAGILARALAAAAGTQPVPVRAPAGEPAEPRFAAAASLAGGAS